VTRAPRMGTLIVATVALTCCSDATSSEDLDPIRVLRSDAEADRLRNVPGPDARLVAAARIDAVYDEIRAGSAEPESSQKLKALDIAIARLEDQFRDASKIKIDFIDKPDDKIAVRVTNGSQLSLLTVAVTYSIAVLGADSPRWSGIASVSHFGVLEPGAAVEGRLEVGVTNAEWHVKGLPNPPGSVLNLAISGFTLTGNNPVYESTHELTVMKELQSRIRERAR